jgi:hypothetical protein
VGRTITRDGFVEVPIPDDLAETVHDFRMKLIEGCAEESEELLGEIYGGS